MNLLKYPNNKDYIRPSNYEIEQFSNQSSIPSWIIKDRTAIKSKIHIGFHWSTSWFKPQNSYLLQKIQSILPLRKKYTMFLICNLNPKKVFRLTHVFGHKMKPKIFLVSTRPVESLPVSKISSTYATKITRPDLARQTNTE